MRDQRLGASFSIDINALKAGLTQANRLIKESRSELKMAGAGAADWSKNEDVLRDKIKALNNIVELQNERIRAQKEEYQRLKDNGVDELSKKMIELRTNINKDTAEMKQSAAESNKYKQALDNLGNEAQDTGNALGVMEKAADKANGGFTIMKGALANLAADGFRVAISGAKKLASAVVDLGAKADDLSTLSKQSGFSVEELQKFEYAAELVDVSSDDIISAVKKLKKNVASDSAGTVDAFKAIGVSVKNSGGQFRDINAIFYDVLSGLGKIENETERDAVAMQLFGKNADTLAGIIDDGGKALKDYGQEAEDLGVIMSTEAVDSAAAFDDAIQKIKATGNGVFYSIGAEIAKTFAPEIDNARDTVQRLAKDGTLQRWAKVAMSSFKNVIDTAKTLAKNALPAAKAALKIVGGAAKFVADNFQTLAPIVLTAVGAIKALSVVVSVSKNMTELKKAVTAAKGAYDALTASISASAAAQTALNASMVALPILGVATAVGILASGVFTLSEEEKREKAAREEATAAIEAKKNAYYDLRNAQDEQAERDVAHIENAELLAAELALLADETGRVKDADKARAEYILGELNEALGTEYAMTGGQIENYQKLRGEISEVIEARKAEIYLNANLEMYKNAIEHISEAEADRTEKLRELTKVEQDFNAGNAEAYGGIGKLEQAYSDALESYAASDEYLKQLYRDKSIYEEASQAALEKNYAKTIELLDAEKRAQDEQLAKAKGNAEEEKKILEERVINLEITAREMKRAYEEGVDGVTEAMVNTARENAEKAKEQYEALGGNIIKGIAKGAGDSQWILNDAMKKAVDDAVKTAEKRSKINSPSRLFADKIGKWIPAGIAVGIAGNTKAIISAVQDQVAAIQNAYSTDLLDRQFGGAVSLSFQEGKKTEETVAYPVVINQTNNYSQAHSRYELYKIKQQTAAAARLALGRA